MSTKSVREMRRDGTLTRDGRRVDSSAEIRCRNKPQGSATPPRKFTDDFKREDEVSIIRTRHGWFDGRVSGRISSLTDWSATVTDSDGIEYAIEKPRDIRLLFRRTR